MPRLENIMTFLKLRICFFFFKKMINGSIGVKKFNYMASMKNVKFSLF